MQLRAKVLLNNSCHEIMRTIDVVSDTRIVRSPGGNISFDNPSRSPFSSRVAGCLDKNVNRIQEFPNQRVISNFAFEIPAYFTNVLIDLEYKRFVLVYQAHQQLQVRHSLKGERSISFTMMNSEGMMEIFINIQSHLQRIFVENFTPVSNRRNGVQKMPLFRMEKWSYLESILLMLS